MKTSVITVVSAFAAVQLIQPLAASAASMTDDRATTKFAAKILRDAGSGRQALLSGNTSAANHDIDAALAVQSSMASRARADKMSMIVPIYFELDDSMILSDAIKTHAVTGATATAMASASPAAMASASPAAMPAPTGSPAAATVRANVVRVTYLALDLDKVKQRLDAAKLAVKNNNRQAAEDSLAAVGSDLIEVSDSGDVPLLTARQDLALAQHAMAAKQFTAASSDLQQASAALKAYSKPGHAAQASQLATEIQSFMPVDSQKSPKTTSKIDGWWSSVKDWFAAHI